jgi:hypothetical protein
MSIQTMPNDFPLEAMPVVLVLRRDVRKPEIPPLQVDGGLFRWAELGCLGGIRRSYFLRAINSSDCGYSVCPMGLHSGSATGLPYFSRNFAGGVCEQLAVFAFHAWWDGLKTTEKVQEAIDFIWPDERARTIKRVTDLKFYFEW